MKTFAFHSCSDPERPFLSHLWVPSQTASLLTPRPPAFVFALLAGAALSRRCVPTWQTTACPQDRKQGSVSWCPGSGRFDSHTLAQGVKAHLTWGRMLPGSRGDNGSVGTMAACKGGCFSSLIQADTVLHPENSYVEEAQHLRVHTSCPRGSPAQVPRPGLLGHLPACERSLHILQLAARGRNSTCPLSQGVWPAPSGSSERELPQPDLLPRIKKK